jgi:hypothetical protein
MPLCALVAKVTAGREGWISDFSFQFSIFETRLPELFLRFQSQIILSIFAINELGNCCTPGNFSFGHWPLRGQCPVCPLRGQHRKYSSLSACVKEIAQGYCRPPHCGWILSESTID